MTTTNAPSVLLVGRFADDGVTSVVKANGGTYIQKLLHSSPANWLKTAELLEQEDSRPILVLVKFTEYTLFHCAQPGFSEARARLFNSLKNRPHRVYMYHTLAAGEFSDDTQIPEGLYDVGTNDPAAQKDALRVLDEMRSAGLHVAPYQTKAELIVSAQAYIEETLKGIVFRLYVPNNQMWREQIDRLIVLFKEHLKATGKADFSLDQQRTQHGTIFTFFTTDENNNKIDLTIPFSEFTSLIDLCLTDPSRAEELLKTSSNISDAHQLVSKYSREARRILLDMEYERKQRILQVQHSLHSELVDRLTSDELASLIREATSYIPPTPQTISQHPIPLFPTRKSAPNHAKETKALVLEVFQRHVTGRSNETAEDREILGFVEQLSPKQTARMTTDLSQLNDPALPMTQRILAHQRISEFLWTFRLQVGNRAKALEQHLRQSLIISL